MDEGTIRADERKRVADALRRYLIDHERATFRVLLDYLELDYRTGMDEGWRDWNIALDDHDERLAARARTSV